MGKILSVRAREVLDSRGNPTVEAEIKTKDGIFRAITASGASTGSYETWELRDGGKRYLGKGAQKAVDNINKIIAKNITGMGCTKQNEIDKLMIELDGTQNKSKLGANAILPVSIACTKAAAASLGKAVYDYIGDLYGKNAFIIPVPQNNIINGGRHAGQENDIQEHMIMPVGAKNFREAIRMSAEVYHYLRGILKKRFGAYGILIGDEGGFAPPQLKTIQERLDVVMKAIEEAGYENEMKLAIDSASSEFFKNGIYTVGNKKMSSGELVDFYADVVSTYPVVSWEDGMAEDDWDGWKMVTKKLGNKIQIVGDDVFVTNVERIRRGIKLKCANSVLIKPNQIGTVTETIEAVRLAHKNGWTAVVSHRSGETEDTFLADFSVGVSSGQLKCGATARSERLAKYNQLIRIEEELGSKAEYAGKNLFK